MSYVPSREEYLFDSLGFVHFSKLLPADWVEEVRVGLEARIKEAKSVKVPFLDVTPYGGLRLLKSINLMKLLEKVLGSGFRLDHAFIRLQPDSNGVEVSNLHGGPGAAQGTHLFFNQNGSPFCTQVSVGIPLHAQGGDEGGLVLLPGSHKSAFAMQGGAVRKHVFEDGYPVADGALVAPRLEQGDIIAFTETMIHGARPLKTTQQRATLYYMFTPGHVSWRRATWAPNIIQAAILLGLESLLRPAYVAEFTETPTAIGGNVPRTRTTW
jgi:hypothetical protein